jgi:hypothetical protein
MASLIPGYEYDIFISWFLGYGDHNQSNYGSNQINTRLEGIGFVLG